jgi:hypothetical protein
MFISKKREKLLGPHYRKAIYTYIIQDRYDSKLGMTLLIKKLPIAKPQIFYRNNHAAYFRVRRPIEAYSIMVIETEGK